MQGPGRQVGEIWADLGTRVCLVLLVVVFLLVFVLKVLLNSKFSKTFQSSKILKKAFPFSLHRPTRPIQSISYDVRENVIMFTRPFHCGISRCCLGMQKQLCEKQKKIFDDSFHCLWMPLFHPSPIETPKIKFLKPIQYGCSDKRKGLVSNWKLGFRSLKCFI